MPTLHQAVVLVTGANGGIGTQFVHQTLARGATKVYATARNPQAWDDERVVPLSLDVTDAASIHAAVESAPDVTVVVNNAGASVGSAGILSHSDEEIRSNVETNFLLQRIELLLRLNLNQTWPLAQLPATLGRHEVTVELPTGLPPCPGLRGEPCRPYRALVNREVHRGV